LRRADRTGEDERAADAANARKHASAHSQ
jgi:hypothetical protein